MKSIAFVTTSKGRLHHIKQTLPLMLAQEPAEIVLVDYGCPDGTGNWVEANHPTVKVVRVDDDPGFCLARARNIGIAATESEWLVVIDGDILAGRGWSGWMQENLTPGHYYLPEKQYRSRRPDLWGTVICARKDLDAIGGYDEIYRAWGGEDVDLYDRFDQRGIIASEFPARFVEAIAHGDEERAGWGGMRTRQQHLIVNRCYREAKRRYAMAFGEPGMISLQQREQLMDTTRAALAQWFEAGARDGIEIRYTLESIRNMWLPDPFRLGTDLLFTLRVQHKEEAEREVRAFERAQAKKQAQETSGGGPKGN